MKSKVPFHTFIAISLFSAFPLLSSQTRAQDQATPEVKEDVDPFAVPDGPVEVLFQFINKVKTTPPEVRTREAGIAHLKKQVAAVVAACDKIMATQPDEETELRTISERFAGYEILSQFDEDAASKFAELVKKYERDERPAIAQVIGSLQLQQRARDFFRMADKEQEKFVDELFAFIDKYGLDQRTVQLAQNLGQALEDTVPQLGAVVYERMAGQLKKLNRPDIQPQIDRMEATVRRLKLPGNLMEIQGATADGEAFNWASYRGKVVLVDFWASWCGPCRAEIPNMKAQLEKYADKGFAIVGINLDNTKQEYQAYVDREELTWVNLMSQNENERGWDNPLAVHYGISGIPTAILVDKEGKVVSMNARGRELNRLLQQLLGPVEEAEGAE